MKEFKSSNWHITFKGSRASAIKEALNFIENKYNHGDVLPQNRYTWRADDGSGFTVAMMWDHTKAKVIPTCTAKWNATRS